MNHWTQKYVGIPYLDRGRTFEGADCYGLIRLVYRDELLIDLASFSEEYPSAVDMACVAGLISDARTEQTWIEQREARPYDVLVFRRGRVECHLGLVVARGRMLHMAEGQSSRIEPYETGEWMPRLTGIYRHFKNASEGL